MLFRLFTLRVYIILEPLLANCFYGWVVLWHTSSSLFYACNAYYMKKKLKNKTCKLNNLFVLYCFCFFPCFILYFFLFFHLYFYLFFLLRFMFFLLFLFLLIYFYLFHHFLFFRSYLLFFIWFICFIRFYLFVFIRFISLHDISFIFILYHVIKYLYHDYSVCSCCSIVGTFKLGQTPYMIIP